MTDMKELLREAAIVVRYYADREGEDCANAYADIELANQLEAAAESMHTTGTEVDSDQDSVHFTAYLEDLLEAERENVRVLREALEYAVDQVPEMGTVPGVKAALATTVPEGGEV